MRYSAEYVGIGHPDRICDGIVAKIVDEVIRKDNDALCGLECAIYTNKVFIDGRIAAGKEKIVITKEEIDNIIRKEYEKRNYGKYFEPKSEDLKIIQEISIECLSNEERSLRNFSDDQNIVTGYAIKNEKTNYLPIAHFVANRIGKKFWKYILDRKLDEYIGSDYKILVDINEDCTFERLTLSVHTNNNISYSSLYDKVKEIIDIILEKDVSRINKGLSKIDASNFYLNGAGDFIVGGPMGDNGLSGKKLAIDFYGPNIPIGGGAIFGKDGHKIDVCGAFRARELAKKLVKEYNFYSIFVILSYLPGESTPNLVEAYEIDEFGTKTKISESLLPCKLWFSIESINNDYKNFSRDFFSISLENGCMIGI